MKGWIFLSTCLVSGPMVTSEMDPKWFLPSRHFREAEKGPYIQLTNTPRQEMEQAQGRGRMAERAREPMEALPK